MAEEIVGPVVIRGKLDVRRGSVTVHDGNFRCVGSIDAGSGLVSAQLKVFQILPLDNQTTVFVRGPVLEVQGPTNTSQPGHLKVKGDVSVSGDIRLQQADCAEHFSVGADSPVEPGSVMVLGDNGELFPCRLSYDKRVAGVVSGAGAYKPGIVLDDQTNKQTDLRVNRQPIALLGKVFCWVDADYGAIEVGDLLTTSPTLGHAMKATDRNRAFGSVIGKALNPSANGRRLIPILVALQ